MDKKVLSEIALYYGVVKMPKDFDIDSKKLCQDILDAGSKGYKRNKEGLLYFKNKDCIMPTSVQFDMLDKYIVEHIREKYKFNIQLNNCHGNIYQPQQQSYLRNQVNPLSLLDSSDFTMLYAVDVGLNSCKVIIEYDDNRLKGQSCRFQLDNNSFVLFPSTLKYMIDVNQSYKTNFVLTCVYDHIR